MNRHYSNVSRYSQTFYAEMRDSIDEGEMSRARIADAAEPETHKAWRALMHCHDSIRGNIREMWRALHDLESELTPVARRYIKLILRDGHKWYDPKPNKTFMDAQRNLKFSMQQKAILWSRLRAAEANEAK